MYPERFSCTIFQDGIENGRKHGIQVVPDNPNRTAGDCIFEAIIDNINNCACFVNKINNSVQYYREEWVLDLMLYQQTDHYQHEHE